MNSKSFKILEDATLNADTTVGSFDARGYSRLGVFVRIDSVGGTDPALDIVIEKVVRHDINYELNSFPTLLGSSNGASHMFFDVRGVDFFKVRFDLFGTSPTFDIFVTGVLE